MKRITFLLISIFLVTQALAQEHCISRPFHRSTELFPGSIGELNSQDYLIFYSDSIEFDGVKYKILESISSPFESKDDLLRYISCFHDFLSASENISGEYISYQMETNIPRIGSDIQFIYFNDCGKNEQYIYVDDGLYYFSNYPLFYEREVNQLERTKEEEVVVEFSYNVDTSALVYFVEEPEFEIITEQVLVKDAYSVLKEIPNEYLEEFALTYNEYSSCENAIFDTLYEQILIKEGGLQLDITPAFHETVSELKLVQNEYEGQGFYERVPQDSFSITLRSSYNELIGYDVLSGCSEFDFYECIKFDFEHIPKKDTIITGAYQKCANGFTSAGKFCYSNSGTVPWVYEVRTYERLIIPASTTQSVLPNEYQTITSVRISNKDELSVDCVESVYDTISYLKLLKPATIEMTMVPAEYGTIQYKKYEDGGVIEVVGGSEDSNFQISTIKGGVYEIEEIESDILQEDKACYLEAIKLRLIEVGYLNEGDKDNLNAFHLGVLTYQLDNNLPIGVIDTKFVNMLDVNFGF